MLVGLDAVSLEAVARASQRAAVEDHDRSAALRRFYKRGHVAADAGDARHLGAPLTINANRDSVCELGRA